MAKTEFLDQLNTINTLCLESQIGSYDQLTPMCCNSNRPTDLQSSRYAPI